MDYESGLEDLQVHGHPILLKPYIALDEGKLLVEQLRFLQIRKQLLQQQVSGRPH